MEVHQLQYLVTIREEGTILKASERLNVSQPAITRAIQKLEEEFGFPLFDRIKNRLVLNDCGEVAVEHAYAVLKELNLLETSVRRSYAAKQTIVIGSNAPAPLWGITSLIESPVQSYVTQDNEELLEALQKHTAGMVILDYPVNRKEYVCRKITEERLYIAVNPDHVLAERKGITFEELNGYNILSLQNVGYWFEVCKENMPYSRFLIQNDVETYNILTKSSNLPIFRTNLTIPMSEGEGKVYVPITDDSASLTFYAVYRKKDADFFDPILDRVREIEWKNLGKHLRRK